MEPITIEKDLILYRGLDSEAVKGDENSFKVRMSSETPVEQLASEVHESIGIAKRGQPFLEILSHKKEDVDLTRFTKGAKAPLLDEHKDSRHLGWIDEAQIDDDKAMRGVVTFDNISDLSVTRRKQVAADSRPYFSIGYKPTRYLGKETLPDGRTGHRFAWQALELSNVAVPADITARKGRTALPDNTECHCVRCNDQYMRSELDDNFVCEDCLASETPAADERGVNGRMGRAGKTFSHEEMRNKVYGQLDKDPRFKSKDSRGNTRSDFAIHSIEQTAGDEEDGTTDEFRAIISHPAYSNKFHSVPFDVDDNDGSVSLGDAEEVQPRTVWESMEHGVAEDGRLIRKSKGDYGNVKYADSGMQADGKPRYPIDTKAHAKAALSYASMPKNKAKYSAADYKKLMGKIKAACKKFGIEVSDEKRSESAEQIFVRSGNIQFTVPLKPVQVIKVGDTVIALE